jgi:hypothetical protein
MSATYDPLIADALIQRYRVPGATREDYIGAVHILIARGWSVGEIADRLGLSDRTVQRHRDMDVEPEDEVAATYSVCACTAHEYDTKRGYFSRERKECAT